MNAVDIPEGGFCPEYYAHQEYMARFEAKHGMRSLAEFNRPVSDTPRPLVAYGPEDEDEFATDTKSSEPTERVTQAAQLTPQPLSALEKLQASGPADIEDVIAAFKADNGIVDAPRQERRSRRKPGEIERAAQAARQYLEADGGAQPVEAVLAAVLDATGLTVPENGKGRTRFLDLAGLQSRPHYRSGRTGCEYTEWYIPQDSQVQAIPTQSASIPPASASNPTAPQRPHFRSASIHSQSAGNPGRSASILSRLLPRSRVSTHPNSLGRGHRSRLSGPAGSVGFPFSRATFPRP